MAACHYCGAERDVRPYGPGGALVCFPCGTSPERLQETERNFGALLEGAAAMSPIGSATIGTPGGPQPLLPEDIETLGRGR